MESLTIHFDKSIREKILKFLSSFSEKDLKITVTEDFNAAMKAVHEDYSEYKSGKTEVQSFDEFGKDMNLFISKNET